MAAFWQSIRRATCPLRSTPVPSDERRIPLQAEHSRCAPCARAALRLLALNCGLKRLNGEDRTSANAVMSCRRNRSMNRSTVLSEWPTVKI